MLRIGSDKGDNFVPDLTGWVSDVLPGSFHRLDEIARKADSGSIDFD